MPDFIVPGSSLVTAAQALGRQNRREGTYPYQWLFPGPNSRHVRASGSVLMPDALGSSATVLDYKVPQSMRFALRGIVLASGAPDWVPGSGDLLFKVMVSGVSPRSVDFLNNVDTPLGSTQSPFPILGRLEFESLSTISVLVYPIANVSVGADGGYQTAMLVGHIYPNNEAGEG